MPTIRQTDKLRSMPLETEEQLKAFAHPVRRDVLTLLAERPATTKQLADALELPRGSVGFHLKSLEAAGMVHVVRTRKVRALTEKYYGRTATTFVLPKRKDAGAGWDFLSEAMAEARMPTEDEDAVATLRHARIPLDQVREFNERLIDLAEEFVEIESGGQTVYGLLLALYPTDRPSLKEDDE